MSLLDFLNPFFTLSPANPLIRTLPLIWLFLWGLGESKKDLKTKSFYCGTLKKICDKNNKIRAECEVRRNALARGTPDSCPIFKNLVIEDFAKKCPKSLEESRDYFWYNIKNMCARYQQAQFFEIIFIQFLLSYVVIALDGFPNIAYIMLLFVVLFIALYIYISTYIDDKPMDIFVNRKLRMEVISGIWLLIVGLTLLFPPMTP